MSWGTYLLVSLVMVVASTVQSSVGMGQGLLSAPLLRILHPALLPGPVVFAGLLTSLVLAARNSSGDDVREVVPALFGRLVGIAIAIVMLRALSEDGLSIAIGVTVLALVLARLSGLRVALTPRTLAATGVASGIGGTIAALAGTPMGLLYEQHARARDFRGPMGAVLAIGGVFTVASLTIAGEMDGEAWLLGLALLPPIVAGWILARWVTPIVDRGMLGPAVLVMAAGSATILLLSQVF